MTRNEGNEDISLRESLPSNVGEQESHATNNTEQAEPRQWGSGRKRACVLVGSSISQLPIWGFAMSYGVFQEYYYDNWTLQGGREVTGIIGTTSNGLMYLSMPFLFALFTKRWAGRRQPAALCGAALACISFILSSFSKDVWHLVATQGVMAALGCALIYSPTTLSVGEWFNTKNSVCNRAVAYGVVLSCKNIVGSACPFLFRGLLDCYGFRTTLRIWAAITVGSSILSIFIFLKHQTFYIYSIATLLQSAGYGIPQTYLGEYARNVTLLSQTFSTLLITLINIPGIAASSFFGFLSDNKHFPLSVTTVTSISAVSSALSAFLFWGLAARGSIALLVLFAITFGFFASGYSATWGGVINEMEREAAQKDEAIDIGMLYGLLNGARGIGYVSGGLVSVPLIKAGSTGSVGGFGYGTTYGALVIFTGLSLAFGDWGLMWKWMKLLHLV